MAWRDQAACNETPIEIFYPRWQADLPRALAICAGCPVREECLDEALWRREAYGVWGGKTAEDRLHYLNTGEWIDDSYTNPGDSPTRDRG